MGEQQSEDCLHLTVWAPQQAAPESEGAQGLPVLLFIHGGDLTFGSANFYNMSLLARDGPAIVVAVNYRLSLWGWLATEELGGGNLGHT